MSLHTLTIHALHNLLARKEVSAAEVVTAFLTRIAELDPKLNCYLTSLADPALALSLIHISEPTSPY